VRAEALVLGDSLMQHIIEGDTVLTYRLPQYDERDEWIKRGGYKGGDLIRSGYISLQSESHPLEFRNVRLFNLEPYAKAPEKLKDILKKLKEREGTR
jgi:hypothetical protein